MSITRKTTNNTSNVNASTATISQTLNVADIIISGDFTTTGSLSSTGRIDVSGNITTAGNVVAGNITTTGTISTAAINVSGIITLATASKIEETITTVSGTSTPFTCNYATGCIFYIPTDYTPSANYNIIITNIPTDTTKSYFITIINRQATGTYYADGVRVSDTATSYTFSGGSGTNSSSTYCVPYNSGGVPVITASPNVIIQQFCIVSVATSAGVFTRYITSSVSQYY